MEIPESSFLYYSRPEGNAHIAFIADQERKTVWTSQKNIAQVFDVDVSIVRAHILDILQAGQLEQASTVRKIRMVQAEVHNATGREVEFYNLAMILAIGHRISPSEAIHFDTWAAQALGNFLSGSQTTHNSTGQDLNDKGELYKRLDRIREIRASRRSFCQKISDLYAESVDYDVNSPITQKFYANVQNKLHWAIHGHTAAELIQLRARANRPNMGLRTWKNAKHGGKILKTDIRVARNYLSAEEAGAMGRLVEMYLDYAENLIYRGLTLNMASWANRFDAFLRFHEYALMPDSGKVTHEIACRFAEKQYEMFRAKQERTDNDQKQTRIAA